MILFMLMRKVLIEVSTCTNNQSLKISKTRIQKIIGSKRIKMNANLSLKQIKKFIIIMILRHLRQFNKLKEWTKLCKE
jgi:hypothetical protein